MQHPEEGIIHAWLDGGLPPTDASAIESHVATCAECQDRVADARGLIAASSRIVSHLDAVPGKVIPATRAKRRITSWRNPWLAAVAAGLVLFVGYQSWSNSRGVTELQDVMQTPGVIRPSLTDSMPIARPRADIEPQQQRAAEQARRSGVDAATSLALPPANAAVQKSSVAAAQPTPAPAPPVAAGVPTAPTRSEARTAEARVATADAGRAPSRAVTGAAAGAGAVAAPTARFERQLESAADLSAGAFVGCYEMSASTEVLPARFALTADSSAIVGLMRVQYVDTEGRSASPIADLGWAVEGGLVVVKTQTGQTLLTLRRTGSAVSGDGRSGSRNGRVVSCTR